MLSEKKQIVKHLKVIYGYLDYDKSMPAATGVLNELRAEIYKALLEHGVTPVK